MLIIVALIVWIIGAVTSCAFVAQIPDAPVLGGLYLQIVLSTVEGLIFAKQGKLFGFGGLVVDTYINSYGILLLWSEIPAAAAWTIGVTVALAPELLIRLYLERERSAIGST
jgi:hypothetical protein